MSVKLLITTLVGKLFLLTSPAMATDGTTYVTYCYVLNAEFKLKEKFPGKFCHFFENGSFLSANETTLTMYSSTNKVIWTKKMHAHHQINVDSKKQILIISSEIQNVDKIPVRFDKLVILNQSGKILKQWRFYSNRKELLKKMNVNKFSWHNAEWAEVTYPGIKKEFTHTNSFYEIGPNAKEAKLSALSQGNYVINAKFDFIIILDKSLRKIVYFKKYPLIPESILHDVQVTADGNFLIYNNLFDRKKRLSMIEEIDPITEKIIWSYGEKNQQNFYSEYAGGVQDLGDDGYLFTDIGIAVDEEFKEANILIVNRQGEIKIKKPLNIFGKNILPLHVKRVDLREFFAKRK